MCKGSAYIYKAIIEEALKSGSLTLKEGVVVNLSNAEEIYYNSYEYLDGEFVEDTLYEVKYDFRHTGEEINLPAKNYSRHYEVDFVAREIDGKWIGWDYWYGGGKHSDPDSIDWIPDAEVLNLDKEEEFVTVVRTFSRKEVE